MVEHTASQLLVIICFCYSQRLSAVLDFKKIFDLFNILSGSNFLKSASEYSETSVFFKKKLKKMFSKYLEIVFYLSASVFGRRKYGLMHICISNTLYYFSHLQGRSSMHK